MEQIAINIDISTLFAVPLFKNIWNEKWNWNKNYSLMKQRWAW